MLSPHGVPGSADEMVEFVGGWMLFFLRQKSRLPGVVEFDGDLVPKVLRHDALEALAVGVGKSALTHEEDSGFISEHDDPC